MAMVILCVAFMSIGVFAIDVGTVDRVYIGEYGDYYGRCYILCSNGQLYHFTLDKAYTKAMYTSALTAMANGFRVDVTVTQDGPGSNEHYINKLMIRK